MSLLYWIVFGLIVGTSANFIVPSARSGFVGSIILGIVGAVVGGYLGEMLFGVSVTGFNMMSLAVAIAGSVLVLVVSRVLMRG